MEAESEKEPASLTTRRLEAHTIAINWPAKILAFHSVPCSP